MAGEGSIPAQSFGEVQEIDSASNTTIAGTSSATSLAARRPTTSSDGSHRIRGRTEREGGGGGGLLIARLALLSLPASNSTTALHCCRTDGVVNVKKEYQPRTSRRVRDGKRRTVRRRERWSKERKHGAGNS